MTTTLTLNRSGLRSVTIWLDRNPHRWDQNSYYSRSANTMCLASWTCALAGIDVPATLARNGGAHEIWATAQALLGLSDADANSIFNFGTGCERHPTVAELRQHIHAVKRIPIDELG